MNSLPSKINSTKHGLTGRGLLLCRVERCFYWDVCPLQAYLEKYWYGYSCPIEVARYEEAYHSYQQCLAELMARSGFEDIVRELSMTEIRAMRADNAVSIIASLPDNRKAPRRGEALSNKIWRYRLELYIKRNKLIKKISELRSATFPSS